MIIKSSTYLSANSSPHATVCTNFNTAGIEGEGAKPPPSRRRKGYANHPNPEAMHAGIVYHWALLASDGGVTGNDGRDLTNLSTNQYGF